LKKITFFGPDSLVGATYNDGKKMAIGTGAEEERATATTIVSTEATDMATVTEMKRGQGQRQREMEC
jgi:hypothetical protein